MKRLVPFLLGALIALSGVILAGAEGREMPQGDVIVICSGVNATTITIGPDGEPVEKVEVCPQGHSIFLAAFSIPDMPVPEARLIATVAQRDPAPRVSRDELTPSARGPPPVV